ncbi:MAG TPA: hypothetical protein VE377_17960 [Candidatus Dormibacteraeota bacterium]|nr:hypothetical protein [Candidatus Dormibacteraeota bacterium]
MKERRKFQLGGSEYHLSADDVADAMQGVPPRSLGKYFVLINGVAFPPKQIIAQTLGRDLVKFTTMDASRILTALGLEVQRVSERRPPSRNKSELLFEQYLAMSGLPDFEFEKEFTGRSQRPDYAVRLTGGTEVLFEVKEFRTTTDDFLPGGGGAYDPYAFIREKIDQGREKFKAFKDHCCCLVLFNRDKPLVDLSWQMIYGAMLGNIGFRIPMNFETGIAGEAATENIFMGGGKMLQYRGLQPVRPQNQTISAILTLDLLPVGRIRFDAFIEELEQERKEEIGVEEYTQLIENLRGTDRDTTLIQVRAVVHENPHARDGLKFPDELFRGPYDERFGLKDGQIRRLYAGSGIQSLKPEIIERYR